MSNTLIAGHERASSQSPHSWTLHAGAASRKKLFPHQSRKVGSCLLIEDHIKNARLQMFFLRTTEAGGWMWGKKKKIPSGDYLGQKAAAATPLLVLEKKNSTKKYKGYYFQLAGPHLGQGGFPWGLLKTGLLRVALPWWGQQQPDTAPPPLLPASTPFFFLPSL